MLVIEKNFGPEEIGLKIFLGRAKYLSPGGQTPRGPVCSILAAAGHGRTTIPNILKILTRIYSPNVMSSRYRDFAPHFRARSCHAPDGWRR